MESSLLNIPNNMERECPNFEKDKRTPIIGFEIMKYTSKLPG